MTKPNMQDIEKEIIRIVNGLIKHIQQTPLRKNVPYDQYTDSEAIQALLALIKKHERAVLGEVDATLWLRNVYGLNDDDNLNAGEVEELLETFMSDLAKLKEVEK